MINAPPASSPDLPPSPFSLPNPSWQNRADDIQKKNIVTVEEVGDELHVKFPRNFSKL